MPDLEVPDSWTPLHATALLLLAVAAADGNIDTSEVAVLGAWLAEKLDGDTEAAQALADEAYAHLQGVWQKGGAAAADSALLAQARLLREEYGDDTDKLRALVVLMVQVAKASPGIHDNESAVIHSVVAAWGLEHG